MALVSILKTKPHKFKIMAYLIEKFEGVDFSHVAITFKDSRLNIRYVVEARGGGVRITSNKDFKIDNFVVRGSDYEVDQNRMDAIHLYCHTQLPANYGYTQLVGLGFKRVKQSFFRLFGIKKTAHNNVKNGEFEQICCELGIRIMQMAKDFVLPMDVEEYGLLEFDELDLKHCDSQMDQEKLDKINGVKK